jgi:opine dehydrogenase
MTIERNGAPVAVLGAGNGGYAMAGDLAARGFKVNFYEHPNFAAGFAGVLGDRTITLQGALGDRQAQVNLATTDLAEALAGVELVNLVVPSTAQALFFAELVGVLKPDQTIVVWAGRFGALELLRLFRAKGVTQLPTIAETDTLPYGVRKAGPSAARILYTSTRLLAGAIPASRSAAVAEQLKVLYPEMLPVENALAVAFSNPALVVYGIGALLNAARIEHMRGEFYLFAEGITPAVAEVMYRAFMEITLVAKALGFPIPQYPRAAFDGPLSLEGACFQSPDGPDGFGKMDGPRDVRGRYMMENIGDALAPITEFGDLAGVDTPVLDSVVTLGSTVCGVDFRADGRNLQRLGLAGLSPDRLRQAVFQGEGA